MLSTGYPTNLYINGVLFASFTGPTPTDYASITAGSWIMGGYSFTGNMADFRVYAMQFNNNQVQYVYTSAPSGEGSSVVVTCTTPTCTGAYGHCSVDGSGVCCGAGTYFIGGLSTSCQACPAGTYGLGNATSCASCAQGKYSSGSTPCATCPANSGSAVGSSTCTPNPGYYNNGGSITTCSPTTCSAVNPITYSQCTTSGSSVCCGSGTYWVPSPTSAGCTACPSGTYGLGSATACVSCAAGTFSATNGASACATCAAGTTSTTGATTCVRSAPAGQYYYPSSNLTVACPKGFFCVGGTTAPQLCSSCGGTMMLSVSAHRWR